MNDKKIINVGHIGKSYQRGFVAYEGGIIGALSATEWKDPKKILVKCNRKEKDDERDSSDRELDQRVQVQ